MTRLLHLGAIAALLLALMALAGCGGGGDTSEPPVTPDTGTLTGTVVRADNPALGISGATVSVRNAAGTEIASGTTSVNGAYTITKIPVGQYTVVVDTLSEADYGSQSLSGVRITKKTTTSLTITVLRSNSPTPTSISLSPSSVEVDVRGHVDFDAAVYGGGSLMDGVTPIFLLSTNIGTLDKNGNFTATTAGTGQVIAICGDMRATADIKVTNARAPQITTYLVAPLKLKASGGKVTITVAANDGDGIASVVAHIYTPGGEDSQAVVLDPRTTDTYRLEYAIPANSNQPDSSGNQAAQRYSLQVVVTDTGGAQTLSDFVDVVVAGLDAPPPPG